MTTDQFMAIAMAMLLDLSDGKAGVLKDYQRRYPTEANTLAAVAIEVACHQNDDVPPEMPPESVMRRLRVLAWEARP